MLSGRARRRRKERIVLKQVLQAVSGRYVRPRFRCRAVGRKRCLRGSVSLVAQASLMAKAQGRPDVVRQAIGKARQLDVTPW